MIYLPDTNVCVAHLRSPDSSVSERFRLHRPEDIALCDIVKAELVYGAYRSAGTEANLALLTEFFAPFVSLPFDGHAAEVYGRIRREMERTGTVIGPHDLFIASIALANGLILVTHNTREFSRVPELTLEDWET